MRKNNSPHSLYIHIPFCKGICHYCDFPKLLYNENLSDKYLVSLKKEIELYHLPNNLETVYIGGGTPTSLKDEQFSFLLSLIDPYIKNVKEFTIEANPESLTKDKLLIMKRHGVNRLSIGVESTNNKILKSIGRIHTFDDVKNSYLLARSLDFDNISFDLILGLPNVSEKMLIDDIRNIIGLNPDHISCYSLTVHNHTVMGIKGVVPPDDDEMRNKYDLINNLLEKAGYIHYEISSWCKPNKYSRHNLTYWKDYRYYGLGLGASGFIDNLRYTNTFNLNRYLDDEYVSEKIEVDPNDDFEYLMLNLRTVFGVDLKEYKNKFGIGFIDKYSNLIKENDLNKYFIHDKKSLHLTYEGMMILDTILLKLSK